MVCVGSGQTREWIRKLVLASGQIYNTFAFVFRISKDGSTWEGWAERCIPSRWLEWRRDPLTDCEDVAGEMSFHGIREKVAICCKEVGLHEIDRV
jgi:hypothetical protein